MGSSDDAMGLRVVIVGVPGVGKSTVVEKTRAAVKGSTVQVFGTAMFEEAKRLKWVENRDEMRKLAVERQKKLQTYAALRISKGRGGMVFIDTHLFIRTPEGFWPGLPSYVVKALKPTHLVLVEASPREIISRRQADTTRYRDVVSEDQVREELSLARTLLAATSMLSGAPMAFIQNGNGMADAAADTVAGIVREGTQT